MGRAEDDAISENIEVVPVVVVSQTFPARPSSIPDIRDFVRRCLAQSPLSEEDNREVGQTVAQALLDAAGPTGAINVSFRIFPDHVEVDVLRSGPSLGTPTSVNALTSFLNSGGSVPLRAGADSVQLLARRMRVLALEVFFLGTAIVNSAFSSMRRARRDRRGAPRHERTVTV